MCGAGLRGRLSTPTALRPKAQGCGVLAATLGTVGGMSQQLQRSCVRELQSRCAIRDATPSELKSVAVRRPRVGASTLQPWASLHNAVGVEQRRLASQDSTASLSQLSMRTAFFGELEKHA